MADKKRVSVNWQMLFILVPIVDLWAAYRIEKFRIYFLIFWIASATIQTFVMYAILGDRYWSGEVEFFSSDLTAASVQIAMMIATLGIAVYFIRKYSKEWNAKLENS